MIIDRSNKGSGISCTKLCNQSTFQENERCMHKQPDHSSQSEWAGAQTTYIHIYIHTFIHMYFIALPGKPTESLTPLAKDSDVHSVQSSSSHPSTSSASSSSHDLDHQSVPTSNENQPCHCVLPPCCHRVLAVFLAVSLVILVVAMVMVGVSSGYPPLHQQVKSIPHRIVLQKNQVQKIDCFNPENVDKVTVNQLHSATNVQLMGTVSLALVPRESLTPHWDNRTLLNYTFGSNLVTNYPLQKWEPFAYMLAGSSVNVTINVTVSTTLMPLGSLNEYNDYEKYIQFSQGTTNEPKPYQRFPINTIVGTAVTTPIVVHEDGFVLFGVYLPPSSWYLYAYSFHRLYYKSSDYSFDCTLYDEDSLCHLSVTDSRHSELCLMASTQGDEFDDEGPEFVEASYTIVTQEFCVVIIAVSGAVFVAAVVVSCIVWACRRRMRPG